jgi:hypothetical protein
MEQFTPTSEFLSTRPNQYTMAFDAFILNRYKNRVIDQVKSDLNAYFASVGFPDQKVEADSTSKAFPRKEDNLCVRRLYFKLKDLNSKPGKFLSGIEKKDQERMFFMREHKSDIANIIWNAVYKVHQNNQPEEAQQ